MTCTWRCHACSRDNEPAESCRFCGVYRLIYVVHKRPGLPAEVVQIQSDASTIQALLDGAWLEAVHMHTPGSHAWVDENGRLKELPPNLRLNGEMIVGPVVFSAVAPGDGEGFDCGFTEEKALAICQNINRLGEGP